MTFLKELKPVLLVTKFLGLAPYRIDNGNLRISFIAIVYSLVVNVLYLLPIYSKFDEKMDLHSKPNKLHDIKTIGRVSIYMSCSLHFFFSLLNHRKFRRFVKNVTNFDAMIGFAGFSTKKLTLIFWANVLLLVGLVTSVRIYYYHIGNDARSWRIWRSYAPFIGFCCGIFQYIVMVSSIHRRFVYMNHVVRRDPNDLVTTSQFPRKHMGLREFWILYAQLINAIEQLNSIFGIQLLFWIYTLAINVVTRIYTIWSQGFDRGLEDSILNSIPLIICALLLIRLTAISHFTACEVNNFAPAVFRVNSRVIQSNFGWDKEDTFAIGQFLTMRRFWFTAAGGFLQIDLPLLQTIVAGITTYLVILKPSSEN